MQHEKVENIADLQRRARLYTFDIIQFTNLTYNDIFLSKYMHLFIIEQHSINDRKCKIFQRLC